MTGKEMLAQFQKLLTISDPALMEAERLETSEIFQILNIAQRMVFKEKYFPSNNYSENILIINNSVGEIQNLIETKTVNTNISADSNLLYSYTIDTSNIDNYAHYVDSASKVKRTIVFPTSNGNGERVPNSLISFIDVKRYTTNSVHSPIIRAPGVLLEKKDLIRIFVDKYTTELLEFYLTYLKYPTDLNWDVECELDPKLHNIVVDTAIQLFRSNRYLLLGFNSSKEQENKQ